MTEEKSNKLQKSNKFWIYFFITIVVLAVVFISLNILKEKKFNELSYIQKETKLQKVLKEFYNKNPNFRFDITIESKQKIKNIIDEKIDNLYSPLYARIYDFSDFHYSISGEYSELFPVVFGEVDNILQEKIFKPVNFNNNFETTLSEIQNSSLDIISRQFKDIKKEFETKSNISNEELEFLFHEMLNITKEDMLNRFSNNTNNLVRMGSIAGAGVIGAVIAKTLSKKIAAKLSIKFGAKAIGASAGAAAGASGGLFCGPAAILCSPIGGIVGGVVGWFAADKIIVELDQVMNEKEFKQELKKLIDTQKSKTKKDLFEVYVKSLEKLSKQNQKKFEQIKEKSIIQIIYE
jgi:hypothetical protein